MPGEGVGPAIDAALDVKAAAGLGDGTGLGIDSKATEAGDGRLACTLSAR